MIETALDVLDPEARARALQNLGNCRLARGAVDEAMALWDEALAIWVDVAGPDSLAAASLYATMASGHGALGDPDTARELRERAARIRGH